MKQRSLSAAAFLFAPLFALPLLGATAAPTPTQAAEALRLHLRSRVETPAGGGQFQVVAGEAEWNPAKTAIVVCDMWDQHWCRGATERVAEMAPRMNEVLKAARHRGVLVIHCPSDTMKFYHDAPQRKLAQQAPAVKLKTLAAGWCPLAGGKEPPLPFDNSHDRCDCTPQCPHGNPWRRQIDTLEIAGDDAITDNAEALYLMRQRGIDHVILLGVHTNMCVLGRPFAVRQMRAQGQSVLLMRDMTDSMHDSGSPPEGLDHFRATERVIEHIEKYWCPTITSQDFLGGAAFSFREDHRPHVVLLIGEDEYQTDRTLPAFADSELADRGLRLTVIHANPHDLNDFPGLEALESAEALFVSVRRRTPPAEQLARIRAFVEAQKPVVGIRTASHAFSLRNDQPPPAGHAAWPEFDAQVLGGHYVGHHAAPAAGSPKTLARTLPEMKDHPVLAQVPAGEFSVGSSLYKTSPLAPSATALVMGRVEGIDQTEPVAWTNMNEKGGRVFYTSLGHVDDFALPAFRRLLVNGVFWALNKPVPD
ncbi:MAG TPA: isochorismatase family protein [Pirellulales bacterium]|jgi:nicotinamidase-related amidase/type 1 glutamine amidotransferase|nr:isochorismatase family protein [Pirellulales bacterium]